MKNREMKSSMLLLITAAIWGFAFVAQRVSIQHVGAFTFNAVRFALGGSSLVPLMLYFKNKKGAEQTAQTGLRRVLVPGIVCGSILFTAASLQQAGLAYTTAGKAAFITGLYIVLVPLLGIFLKQRVRANTWLGILLAVAGLYFLSVKADFTIAIGDLLEIVGAFFWALHILAIDHFTKKADALALSFAQFMTCSALSFAAAWIFEDMSMTGILQAAGPILYGGLLSVGVAYTLQAVAQRNANPSHAAIIMSMETVFAAIGGALFLNENLGARGYLGCALMMAGMLLTQIRFSKESTAC